MSRDWMQRGHQKLHEQANQTVNYVTVELVRLGLMGITDWITEDVTPKLTAMNQAYELWNADPSARTPLIISTLIESEAAFIPFYRQLYNGFLRNNPMVTDTDLVAMGLPMRSAGRTPSPVPATVPTYTVKTPLPGIVELHYYDDAGGESRKYAKPKGVHGVEIRWAILDEAPVDWETLTHSAFDTATPFRLTFEGNNRGNRVYFALRWENTTGQKGPWSAIGFAFIP